MSSTRTLLREILALAIVVVVKVVVVGVAAAVVAAVFAVREPSRCQGQQQLQLLPLLLLLV